MILKIHLKIKGKENVGQVKIGKKKKKVEVLQLNTNGKKLQYQRK